MFTTSRGGTAPANRPCLSHRTGPRTLIASHIEEVVVRTAIGVRSRTPSKLAFVLFAGLDGQLMFHHHSLVEADENIPPRCHHLIGMDFRPARKLCLNRSN